MSQHTEYRCDGPNCNHTTTGWIWREGWLALDTPGRYTTEERARKDVIFADPTRRHFHHHQCLTAWLKANT